MSHGHAKLGPSSAKRWMSCPGSVKLIDLVQEALGPEEENPYAALGNALHDAAEYCLVNDKIAPAMVGRTFYNHEVTADDIDRFEAYVELVRNLPGQTFYEQKVVVVKDSVWGTSDAVNVYEGKLTVVDLKTGYNKVDAEDNPQLLLYALGAYLSYGKIYEITEIEMIISQPSVDWDSRCTIGMDVLAAFYESVLNAIAVIKHMPDKLQASDDACRYCRARGTCPELQNLAANEAKKDFQDMDLQALSEALEMLPILEHYISGVKARAHETIEKGDTIPGYKMVEGRKSRAWINEADTIRYLSRKIPKFNHNAFVHKLLSPAQMEKVVKKLGDDMFRPAPKLKEFIESKAGKPTMVPESDKRQPLVYGQRAAADFADVV